MRITVDGQLGTGITPKNLIMFVIREIGADGSAGFVIEYEYVGSAFDTVSVEGR